MEVRRLGGYTKLTQDQDLSGYAQLSGATFTGDISATNLSVANTDGSEDV